MQLPTHQPAAIDQVCETKAASPRLHTSYKFQANPEDAQADPAQTVIVSEGRQRLTQVEFLTTEKSAI